jgi:pyruvate, water dikinase
MQKVYTNPSTGLLGLDHVFTGLRAGDNVVWQVDAIADYVAFVHPFCREAAAEHRTLIYFRFADHEALLPPGVDADVHEISPHAGFEPFISQIFDVIERTGIGACYVFDCLSELGADWYSDRMLGNFFMLTCPYLYSYETIAYFSLIRNRNSATAIDAIHGTAQIVLDIYRQKETIYLHPLKVYKRHTDTMYMLHAWQGEQFVPVRASTDIARILTAAPQPWLDFAIQRQDLWTRAFAEAQELAARLAIGDGSPLSAAPLTRKLLGMAITRHPQLQRLAEQFLGLTDLLEIGSRLIGTGLIGGKSVGMLLARAIVKRANPRWAERLEAHDSFFIGADVFYTYLVVNGCWWVRRRMKDPTTALDGAEEARQRILGGAFPKDIQDRFVAMLDYFGQSPIIVRSSSLLEDAYGNAFSGKYESVFCASQGTPEARLERFLDAVRTVYASTMNREALEYRMHFNLLEQDEQMALLVQRVSGQSYGHYFYPQIAGTGFSYNPFVWNSAIDPRAGFLRIVFGLGTRAVDRADDDYTRIVALNAPRLRPEGDFDQVRKYTQRRIDLLDLSANQHQSRTFEETVRDTPELPLHLFASRDAELERRAAELSSRRAFSWVLTFDELLGETGFVAEMREMLAELDTAYQHPVDVEFTANFTEGDKYSINLLQCRPFQVRGQSAEINIPRGLPEQNVLLTTRGPIIGNGMAAEVERLVYVAPAAYGAMKQGDRYALARLIGRLTHLGGSRKANTIMLVGPGRWGTSTPSLGVPVSFAEINTVTILCECALMHEGLIPDVSLGTHFFNDIVELNMLYLAIYPERPGHLLNQPFFESAHNALTDLIPDAAGWANAVRVIDTSSLPKGVRLYLSADTYQQEGVCFIDAAHRS